MKPAKKREKPALIRDHKATRLQGSLREGAVRALGFVCVSVCVHVCIRFVLMVWVLTVWAFNDKLKAKLEWPSFCAHESNKSFGGNLLEWAVNLTDVK